MKPKAKKKTVKAWGISCSYPFKGRQMGQNRFKFYVTKKFAAKKARENRAKVIPIFISF